VVVPRALRAACEGRDHIELGMPGTSDLPDILTTLLALYPSLRSFVADDRRARHPHFSAAQMGRRVYLFTSRP
jgi:hypothetical protein